LSDVEHQVEEAVAPRLAGGFGVTRKMEGARCRFPEEGTTA
jgi:hypothetical protein